jgi:hypothetical protein
VRVFSFGLLLPFAIIGLWQIFRLRERVVDWPVFILLCLFVVIYSLIHLLSWAMVRYRLPVDGVLIVFAAYGLVSVLDRFLPLHHPNSET